MEEINIASVQENNEPRLLKIVTPKAIRITESHVYVELPFPDIHFFSRDLIEVNFEPRSLEVKFHVPGEKTYFKIQRLYKDINVEESSFTVEPDTVRISMKKAKEEEWIFIPDVNLNAFTDYYILMSRMLLDLGYVYKWEDFTHCAHNIDYQSSCWRMIFIKFGDFSVCYKDLEEVIHELKENMNENPDNYLTFVLLRSAVFAKKNKDCKIMVFEAEKERLKSTKKSPLAGKKRLADDLKNEGNEYFRNKRFKEAAEAYKKAIELDPKCAVLLLNFAYSLYYLGEIDLSKIYVSKAMELDVFNGKVWLLMSKLSLTHGNYMESLSFIHMAMVLDPLCRIIEKEHVKLENFMKYSLLYINFLKNRNKEEALILKQKLFKLNSSDVVYKCLFKIMVNKNLLYLAKEEALSYMGINAFEGFILINKYLFIKEDEVGLKGHLEQFVITYDYINYKNALEFKNKGDKYFERGLFGEAIECYLSILQEPNYEEDELFKVYFKIGCSKFNLSKIDEAITYFNKAIIRNTEYHVALVWRGNCYLRQKNFEEARRNFELANLIEPSDEYNNLRKVALKGCMEDFEYVKKTENDCRDPILKKEISLKKNLANCKKERGNICYKNGHYEEAAKLYSEAIELDDDNPLHYANRSACYLALKKFSDALADCEQTLNRDPRSVKGLFRRGRCHLANGQTDKATESFKEALKISKNNKILVNELERVKCFKNTIENGIKEFKNKRYEKAESYFSEALVTAEGCLEIHLKKLECLLIQEKYKELLSSALLAEKLLPDVSKICYFISLVYFYEDEEVDGKKYLEKYKNLNYLSETGDLHSLETLMSVKGMQEKGDKCYNNNNLDEAFDLYTSAKNLVPTKTRLFSLLTYKIGLVLHKKNEVVNAIHSFSSSIDSQNDFVDAYIKRGECLMECNMITEAVKNYEILNKISPSKSHKKRLQEAEEKLRNTWKYLSEDHMEHALSQIKSSKAEKLLKDGKYEDAAKMYSNAIHFNSGSAQNYAKRSFCFTRLKDYDKAFDDAKQSVQLDSECLEGIINLGNCYLTFGDVARSIESFNKAEELEKNNKNVKRGLSKSTQLEKLLKDIENSLKDKHFEKGLKQIERASNIAFVSSSLLLDKAECLIGLGRLDDVLHLMNNVPSNMNERPEVFCIKGLYYYHKDERAHAESHLLKATERAKGNMKIKQKYDTIQKTYSLKQKGDDSFLKGNWSQSLEFYTNSLECGAGNVVLGAKLLYNIGINNLKLNYEAKAIKSFSLALEYKRDYLKPLEKRAECYRRNKDLENALKDYKELYRLSNKVKYLKISEKIEVEIKKESKDPYKTLRVPRNASTEEVRKSYKRLAKEFHPDRAGSEEEREKGEEKFKEISVAYSILSDPLRRERYDRGEDEDDDIIRFTASMFRNMFFSSFHA